MAARAIRAMSRTRSPALRRPPRPTTLLWAMAAAAVMVASTWIALLASPSGAPNALAPLPRGGGLEATMPSTRAPTNSGSAPVPTGSNWVAPHLSTAIRNSNSTIYTYKNQGENQPQDSQVSLWVNATGDSVPSYANVQVVFVVETTLYDGVYDPTQDDPGSSTCSVPGGYLGPCEESDGVPFFMANAGTIAADISANNPAVTVSYAMVDYFATLDEHDDGDGAEYHVDIPNFVSASQFQGSVISGFKDPVMDGNTWYPDSDFSDSFLDSSAITAMYGALQGSGLAWNSNDHHVIVWVGSSAPRDPNYPVNYADTHSDENTGMGSTCEPSYKFGSFTSPDCEGWISAQKGNPAADSIAALANSEGVTIDAISLPDGMTIANSGDYTSTTAGQANVPSVIDAACDIAHATHGSWSGPSGDSCPSSDGGAAGTLPFVADGLYSNPTVTNPSLLSAITSISFGPVSVSNVTGTSNGAPIIQFVPAQNITPDPVHPDWAVSCSRNGVPLSGCQQTPTQTTVGNATIYGWDWPASSMVLNDTWKATFNVVAVGPPYNQSYALDACTQTGCNGSLSGAYSMADYKNYAGTPTTVSFPASDIYVVYPGMSVVVNPIYARGAPGLTQTFSCTATGGLPPYTYQWTVGSATQSSTTTTMTYTFSSASSSPYTVRCLVHDSKAYKVTGVSAVALVSIVAPTNNLFYIEGNVTDKANGAGIVNASVALNGTSGSTLAGSFGAYLLGPIPNGTYRVFVNASGFYSYNQSVTVSGTTWFNAMLQPIPTQSYAISGNISSFTTGAPLAGASVTLAYQGVSFGATSTNAQGQYSFSSILNSTYSLTASLGGYNPATASVTVQGANVVQNLWLTPLPPPTYYITGVVQTATTPNTPIPGATLLINATLPANTTGSNGVYLFSPLSPGVYNVSVSASGYVPQYAIISITTFSQTHVFSLAVAPPPPTPTFSVFGSVLSSSTGKPINDSAVVIYTGTGAKVVAQANSSRSGDYDINGLKNGSYDAVVGATGYQSVSVGFGISGANTEQNFHLSPISGGQVAYFTVQGVVTDAATGDLLQGANVTIATVGSTLTDADGSFSFTHVANGSAYAVSASLSGFETATQTFSVSGTNVDLTIALTPLSSVGIFEVSGLVEDQSSGTGIDGATVIVVNSTSVAVTPSTTVAGGGFTLEIPDGHFELEATAQAHRAGFVNITVKGAPLSDVVILLVAEIPQGSSQVGGSPNGLFSPGPDGLYLQLWVPVVVALVALAVGLALLKRRRGHLGNAGKEEEDASKSGPEAGPASSASGPTALTSRKDPEHHEVASSDQTYWRS